MLDVLRTFVKTFRHGSFESLLAWLGGSGAVVFILDTIKVIAGGTMSIEERVTRLEYITYMLQISSG